MSQSHSARQGGSPGSVLASARQHLNLTIGDVARHLKLSPAQVEALEAGAYERLPGPVFVRGFLRNYAKLLDIDPQPLLRTIEAQIDQTHTAEERPRSPQRVTLRERSPRWPLYTVLAAALIVGALAVYEFGFNEPARTREESGTPQATQNAAIVAEGAAPVPGETAEHVESPVATQATAPLQQPPAAEAQIVSAVDQAPTKERGSDRQLYFRFDEESWVEVRDRNNRVVFSKLNPAGSEQRISATPPLKVVVGNAPSVHLDYDSKPVNLVPHTAVSVARLTLE